MLKKLLSLFLFTCSFLSHSQLSDGQLQELDSLKLVADNAEHDTVRVQALMFQDYIIFDDRPVESKKTLKQIDSICNYNLSNGLTENEKQFFIWAKIWTYNSLGLRDKIDGNFASAIKSYMAGLSLAEKQNDRYNMMISLYNIGIVYKDQKEPRESQKYHRRMLKIAEEDDNVEFQAEALSYIGITYADLEMHDSAMYYLDLSMNLHIESDNTTGYAHTLNSKGWIYRAMGDTKKAIKFAKDALEVFTSVNDRYGMAMASNNLAESYMKLDNFKEAKKYLNQSLVINQSINNAVQIKNVYRNLWKVNKGLGNYQKSLFYYENYTELKDSLDSEANQKEVIRQEFKYHYEKQAAADSILSSETAKVKDAQIAMQKATNKQQAQQKIFLYIGLGIALLFGAFIFNRLKITRKQKITIEEQKNEVDRAYDILEEKNTEILDSIAYAKRIQTAILPPDKLVKEYLQSSFVLYEPKDVVAGDFYWMEPKGDEVLFAAADCTGHGVPGAMVSVICNNGLNRSTREFGLTDPGEILTKTREIVIQEFEKSEEEVKDGMDIALCALNGLKLKYAGAHNPLWIIRKNAEEIEEIKANKEPIGKFLNPRPYTTHAIQLNEGDQFYIFSDGYADQFGGDKGKKFKTSNFKRLLLQISNETMSRQKELIAEHFDNWKGDLEQLDDVCVIGVRV